MGLNTTRLGRSKQLASSGGGNFFKMKNGKNTLRFFSFNHEVEQADFDRGIYKKSDGIKVGEEFDEVERVCYLHFTEDGVENCIRVNCPICEKSDEYLESKDKADQKLGRDMRAAKRFYVNMVNIDDVEKGMQIVPLPGSVFNTLLEYLMDSEYGDSILGVKGRDFIIARDTAQTPDKMYTVKLRDRERCEELDEDLQANVSDLFKMKNLDAGWSSNKEGSDDKPAAGKSGAKAKDEGRPATSSKAKPESKAKPDPEDDDDKPNGSAKPGKGDENSFEDKDDDKKSNMRADGRKQEREIPAWIKKGVKCVFTNRKGEDEEGLVTGTFNTDEETVEVETDTSFWDLDYDDIRPLKGGKERNRK